MSYKLRYSPAARLDLRRLYGFLLDRDPVAAEKAIGAIERAIGGLADFPFSSRKARNDMPLLRELVIPFSNSGYVALYEIEDSETVTILAVRHQREDDYH